MARRSALIRFAPNAEKYVWLGRALHANSKPEQAIAAYDTSLEWKPKYAYAYFCRGNSLKRVGRIKDALGGQDPIGNQYASANSGRWRRLSRTLPATWSREQSFGPIGLALFRVPCWIT